MFKTESAQKLSGSPATALLALTLIPFAGCTGSTGSSANPGINEGTAYNTDSFSYTDPHAPSFHPLGSAEFVALRRDELLLVSAGDRFTTTEHVYYREDDSQGSAFTPLAGAWLDTAYPFEFGYSIQSVTKGDLDGDGRPEPISAGIDRGEVNSDAYVRIGKPDRIGGALGMDNVINLPLGVNAHPGYLHGVAVEAADVDNDGFDELIVAEFWRGHQWAKLRIFDLVDLGMGPALSELYSMDLPAEGVMLSSGQFDDDAAEEFLITSWFDDVANVALHDDMDFNFGWMGNLGGPYPEPRYAPLVAQFDEDPYDEVVIEKYNEATGDGYDRRYFDYWDAQGAYPNYIVTDDSSSDQLTKMAPNYAAGLVTADRDRDGNPEVLWATCYGEGGSSADMVLRSWEPTTGEEKEYALALTQPRSPGLHIAVQLCVLDDNANGRETVLVGYGNHAAVQSKMRIFRIEHDALTWSTPGSTLPTYEEVDGNVSGTLSNPLMVAGDFDDDGLRLRWTGDKHLELPSPIPMVLLAAPPTKAGIDQNYDDTGSTYSVANSQGDALELSMGASLSVSGGVEVEDVFGLFGVESTVTIEAAYEKSLTTESTITRSNSFSGSFDKDSIVFSGVLHQVYDYEILAAPNPDAVGTTLTINVPVDSHLYKWSLDFYNQSVAPENAIPASVLGHTIGDPTSYPREVSLMALLESEGGPFAGWAGTETIVGEGSSNNGVLLEIESVTNVGDTIGFSVESNSQIKAGGVTVGATVSLSGAVVYTVTTARTTSFEGEIGDIDLADWDDWFYLAGMVVYTREVPGELPYQVLQYWTDPLGVAYP